MRTISFYSSFFLSFFFFTGYVQAQTSMAHVGLVYPWSTNGKNAGNYTNHFSLHLIAGVSKAETGVAIAGGANIIRERASGVEIAGFSNHIGNSYHSAQFAGFMNQVKKNADGLQVAGFLNLAEGLHGLEVAGFANIVSKDANGTQVAGFMNQAKNNSALQLAGFLNGEKNGDVQIAGFLNQSADVHTQIAGFLNIAKKVKGVQIGFINIADSSEHPIGVLNIVKGGEKQASISIDETGTLIGAFKSGSRVLYGVLGMGYNVKNSTSLYALQAGIGMHLPLFSHFRIDVEGTNTVMADFKKGYYHRPSLGIFPTYRFGRRIALFAGSTFNYLHTEYGVGKDLRHHYIWSETVHRYKFNAVYVGVAGGAAMFF
ncbi:hypothetical protein ACDQ55_08850 [Chitinophaga sp. 30R24]|uniref:hypothetical protein n=1 Tax=Chitinophaga sp. 30R24 TaxID=3248838 RepID=UPI003B91C194